MILNPDSIDKLVCDKDVARYLIYKCGIPILSFDCETFYFSDTLELRKAVEKLPFMLKVFGKYNFIGKGGLCKN